MFIYAIYNQEHDKLYIGQTVDIDERIRLHNNKAFITSFTSRFDGEWELIYKERVKDRKSALIREKQLKSYQGRQFIKSFIPR